MPDLPEPIVIPYNGRTNVYTYEKYNIKWAAGTLQRQLYDSVNASGELIYDAEGFARINGCYVIAVRPKVGAVGDYLDVYTESAGVISCIVGDEKGDDAGDEWGHLYGNSISVVEFCVLSTSWYDSTGKRGDHANPGTPTCKPEWKGQLQKIQWVGNYFNNPPTFNPESPVNPSDPVQPNQLTLYDGKNNIAIVTGWRRSSIGIHKTVYAGTIMADGYVYFNDELFFRCWKDSAVQTYAAGSNSWVYTDAIADVKVTEFETDGLLSLLFGGSSWAPPTDTYTPPTEGGEGGTGSTDPTGNGIEAAIAWIGNIATDESHGYDQSNRWGPDYDCSSLIYEGFRVGGGFAGLPVHSGYTGTMIDDFTKVGFVWHSELGRDSQSLRRGDILLNISNHTALYIGNGQTISAHCNEIGGITGGATGDQTGREICYNNYWTYKHGWDGVLRYAS